MPDSLPEFVSPMLARLGEAFDSDDHLFEVKWDGIRGLVFDDGRSRRIVSRRRNEFQHRYPEFEVWQLPAGTVLAGEVVVFKGDRPDFREALSREQARGHRRVQMLARSKPATFVVFDLMYLGFESVMGRPLTERRELLQGLIEEHAPSSMVISDGVVGAGRALFEHACERELEGVVAKRLNSSYQPGRRTGAWTKIKRSQTLYCAIVGYLSDEDGKLKSLALASDFDGTLEYCGNVGSGLSDAQRERLRAELGGRLRDEPIVPLPGPVQSVEPGLFCTVSFLERTEGGMLRAPVFRGLVDESGQPTELT